MRKADAKAILRERDERVRRFSARVQAILERYAPDLCEGQAPEREEDSEPTEPKRRSSGLAPVS